MRNLSILFLFFFFINCQSDSKQKETKKEVKAVKLIGKTMGTTYSVIYLDKAQRNFQKEIDALLVAINLDLSPYIEESFISQFNQDISEIDLIKTEHPHFEKVYQSARQIYKKTDGSFDPTVMPLVNYWGFGYTEKRAVTKVDTQKINELKALVGFEKIKEKHVNLIDRLSLSKSNSKTQLDFGGIAKGYGVDQVAVLLEKFKIQNYLIEIGGEIRAKGKNDSNNIWTIAINTPKEDAGLHDVEVVLELDNRTCATSGNYRNFHEVNGVKYGHELNPKTGFTEKNELLSVSVFAKDCMTADGYATAFMILGLEKSKAIVETIKDLDACFIYGAADGKMEVEYTKGIEKYIKE